MFIRKSASRRLVYCTLGAMKRPSQITSRRLKRAFRRARTRAA